MHLKNLPPKNCTPIIEKMSQNTKHTRSTLKMDGIAYIRALTTIRMPCHLDIARNGRNARKVRSDRRTFKFSFSSISNENTDTCKRHEKHSSHHTNISLRRHSVLTNTMMKSSMVQKLVKYFVNPNAIHFNIISIINIKLNTKLVQ